jgi:autotransporter-associated beta strand protein
MFFDHSTAANATIFGGNPFGEIDFFGSSSAGDATIQCVGTQIFFTGSSKGGTAAITLSLGGFDDVPSILDISGHNALGVTIGSLEGEGNAPFQPITVFLGANNLTIGSNNLSTTFAGVIQDGGYNGNGGTGGSLTKIGSGTLTLSGANTYTGNTKVNGGVLQVDGSITSNTFVNQSGTLAGTGTVNGNVVNNVRVSPGSVGAPGMLTIVGNYRQAQYATLMIQIAGARPDQFSVLNVLGSADLNGFLDPVLLNGFVPTLGQTFTFLDYASLTGEFARIKHRVFDNGMLQWSVIYEGNQAILIVEQHVPDQGSTFLLLTLGLLGIVTYHRQLARKQFLSRERVLFLTSLHACARGATGTLSQRSPHARGAA